jgi:methylated-DNA-[protein]-cysteine S-methyltransferase
MTGPNVAPLWDVYPSPLGPLAVQGGPRGLTALLFPGGADRLDEDTHDPAALSPATTQLDEYFTGKRRAFDLPLDLVGTPFQQRVWHELGRIPYGSTVSYTELARRVGRPGIVRAVGAAVGRTPVPIIVPCHRVLGVDGALTGYGGGLERKRALLDLERGADGGTERRPTWAARQLAML